MPLIESEEKFLIPFLENSNTILQEYQQNKSRLTILETEACLGWKVSCPFRGGFTQDAENMPTIKTIISNVSPEITITMVMISDVVAGLPEGPHQENLPTGLKRFHVPIQHNPTARLNVYENDKLNSYSWQEGKSFEFLNPECTHFISCDEGSDRIVLMIDAFTKPVSKDQVDSASFFYKQWINNVGYKTIDGTNYRDK